MNCLRPYQNDILDRTRTAYRDGYKAPCIVSPCGSGKSVMVAEMAKCATEKGNRVLFLVHRKELCDQIESTFKWWGVDMSLCDVSMVQTVCRRLDKIPEPGLIITDENHHALASSYRKIYEYFHSVKRIGVTATPIRLNGSGLGDVNDILILGPTVSELIEWGNLSDYRYFAPSLIDTSSLHVRAGEFKQDEVDEEFKKVIWGDVIEHYRMLADNKQAICYCYNINRSKRMADEFNQHGITASHIDGDTNKSERNEIINKFRSGDIKILCNVDLISEGFDVPDCEAVILLRPTKSLSLYIQQSMRCMRFKPGKTAVIIDHVGNVERFGLPDMDREWSLNPIRDKAQAKTEFPIRQCNLCFTVFSGKVKTCPECGKENIHTAKEIEEIKEAELKEVKRQEEQRITLDYRDSGDCKNINELAIYAKNMGYKPGWTYHQAKIRGWL